MESLGESQVRLATHVGDDRRLMRQHLALALVTFG